MKIFRGLFEGKKGSFAETAKSAKISSRKNWFPKVLHGVKELNPTSHWGGSLTPP